ncbi:MAG: ExbD/TolR family protein, partial [Lysobacteraceae bacterium]
MKLSRDARDDEPEINLVSLIDVIFCIILFLVVTTTFDVRTSLRLQLPTADGQVLEAGDQPMTVVVDAQGRLYLGTRELPTDD